MRGTILLLTLATGYVVSASAQNSLELRPGQRARLSLLCDRCESPVGKVISVTPDSIVMQTQGRLLAWRTSLVRRADVSIGKRDAIGEGVLIGAALGAALGAATWSPCTDTGFMACFMYPSQGTSAMALGATGALTGLIAGSRVKKDIWRPANDPRVRVGLSARGLGASIGFGPVRAP